MKKNEHFIVSRLHCTYFECFIMQFHKFTNSHLPTNTITFIVIFGNCHRVSTSPNKKRMSKKDFTPLLSRIRVTTKVRRLMNSPTVRAAVFGKVCCNITMEISALFTRKGEYPFGRERIVRIVPRTKATRWHHQTFIGDLGNCFKLKRIDANFGEGEIPLKCSGA